MAWLSGGRSRRGRLWRRRRGRRRGCRRGGRLGPGRCWRKGWERRCWSCCWGYLGDLNILGSGKTETGELWCHRSGHLSGRGHACWDRCGGGGNATATFGTGAGDACKVNRNGQGSVATRAMELDHLGRHAVGSGKIGENRTVKNENARSRETFYRTWLLGFPIYSGNRGRCQSPIAQRRQDHSPES